MPLDGMRKTIAKRMTDSFRDVPHFPLTIDIEIDALLNGARRDQQALAGEVGREGLRQRHRASRPRRWR